MLPLFNSLMFGFDICLWVQNMKPINMSEKRLLLGQKNAKMGYSSAYSIGAEWVSSSCELELEDGR